MFFLFLFFIKEVKFLLQILTSIFYAFISDSMCISIIKKGDQRKTLKTITTRCLVVKFSCKDNDRKGMKAGITR